MGAVDRWYPWAGGCLVASTALVSIVAPHHDALTLADTTWARWDSGLYYTIAKEGYSLQLCPGAGADGPWCGTAGWFPGFPAAMRVIGRVTDAELYRAGAFVALVAWVVTVVLVCRLLARRGSFVRFAPAALLLAVFPGSIYERAVFPVSMTTAALAAILVGLERDRPWLVAVAGAVATVAYPSGVVCVAASAPYLVAAWRREPRAVRRAALAISGPVVAYLGVLLMFGSRVGRWNAWFLVQEKYGHGLHSPLAHLWSATAPLRDGTSGAPVAPAVQRLLVLVAVAVIVVSLRTPQRAGERLEPYELGAASLVLVMWAAPLVVGGTQLSLYRAEALLVPMCVLWPRVQGAIRWVVPVLAVPLFVAMAQLFFDKTLV